MPRQVDRLLKNMQNVFAHLAEMEPFLKETRTRQAIYDQCEEAKRVVDRKIKARERELIKQIQKEYDTIAPVQDMRAQLEGDVELLSPILCTLGRVRYALVERSRIAARLLSYLKLSNFGGGTPRLLLIHRGCSKNGSRA